MLFLEMNHNFTFHTSQEQHFVWPLTTCFCKHNKNIFKNNLKKGTFYNTALNRALRPTQATPSFYSCYTDITLVKSQTAADWTVVHLVGCKSHYCFTPCVSAFPYAVGSDLGTNQPAYYCTV